MLQVETIVEAAVESSAIKSPAVSFIAGPESHWLRHEPCHARAKLTNGSAAIALPHGV